jgi:hypothetical protein
LRLDAARGMKEEERCDNDLWKGGYISSLRE